ncbi:glycoside hydrolase family 3 C-terminal domain-containing protein [Myxococcota bacterium]
MKKPNSTLSSVLRSLVNIAFVVSDGLMLAGCTPDSAPRPELEPLPSIAADPSRPLAERVQDLVSRLTLREKISQMGTEAPAIRRLGIPAYNWWNEALHGVARAGTATVFPQSIGLAATWNPDLMKRMAVAIANEGRAKHHESIRHGDRSLYTGLTFFGPNINLFRDPRWGRGQETYGEDPYLTARLAVPFIQGLQGDDPEYLKTIATPKHFAVHSGPEALRQSFNAVVSESDLRMTYLPAFQAAIEEAKAESIMGAYNRMNGEACCASPKLLQKVLREEWGFSGYVVSDCGAIDLLHNSHRLVESAAEAAALAVKAGCDLECGCTYGIPCDYRQLAQATEQGLLTAEDIDRAVTRLFTARFRLGMFDPDERVTYAQIPFSVVDSPEHQELALEVARQSLVLLKNERNLLPLDHGALSSIAVIGPNADSTLVLAGNYMGTPSQPVSVLAGIRAIVAEATSVTYAQGSGIVSSESAMLDEAVQAARNAELAILVLGLSQQLEGEQSQEEGNPPGVVSRGDRDTLDLPPAQEGLLEAVSGTGTPTVLVLINGSALSINWAAGNVPAILEAWYPGQAGGTAVAEALFGFTNPGGRLPVTFYRSDADLPPFEDYDMQGRTYRYFGGGPLYGFGFGLSYTSFAYTNLRLSPDRPKVGESVLVAADVENTGTRSGDEVAEMYVQDVEASSPVPVLQLQGFTRLHLAPGEKQTVEFALTPAQMSFADEGGAWVQEPGVFRVWVGGRQPNLSSSPQFSNVLEGRLTLE